MNCSKNVITILIYSNITDDGFLMFLKKTT